MTRLSIILAAGVSALAFSSAAQAADLIISEPVPSVGVVDVGGDWDGMYVGVFGGYVSGTSTPEAGFGDPLDASGWLVGAALGANFSVGSGIVAGIVGDVAWSNILFETPGATFEVDWTGSLRGKLGFDGGAFMPYLTGGLAVAHGTFTELPANSTSGTHIGWTVGAGVDIAVTEDVSLDLLYRYSDYGAAEYDFGMGLGDMSYTEHRVTAGINWHFN